MALEWIESLIDLWPRGAELKFRGMELTSFTIAIDCCHVRVTWRHNLPTRPWLRGSGGWHVIVLKREWELET
jgi:hypothetical protein